MGHKFATRADRMKASEIRELLKLLDQPDILSFAGGIPDADLFPTDAFSRSMAEAIQNDAQALQYSTSEGYLPLREWLASEMDKLGIACGSENILITSGSQQALDYLGKLYLSPGDTALVTAPTYLGALGAFNAYEPTYDSINLNGNRGSKDYDEAAKSAGGEVKFAYVTADFSNPTGETLTEQDRHGLLQLGEDLDCAIVEDAAYQALRYEGEAVAPILALEMAVKKDIDLCRTIYCGSFSKTLSPGLRVGWVCASKDVISRMVLIKQASDLHSATLNQMAIYKVATSIFDAHVEKVRAAYRVRRDAMLSALERHMPKGVEWTRPEGGMFVWLTLPKGVDGARLLNTAVEEYRVAFVPGAAFFADGSGRNCLRLSFSCADPETIDEGMRRLAECISEFVER